VFSALEFAILKLYCFVRLEMVPAISGNHALQTWSTIRQYAGSAQCSVSQRRVTAMLTRFVGIFPRDPLYAMHTLEDIFTSVSHRAWQVVGSCTAELTLGIDDAIV